MAWDDSDDDEAGDEVVLAPVVKTSEWSDEEEEEEDEAEMVWPQPTHLTARPWDDPFLACKACRHPASSRRHSDGRGELTRTMHE